jgi:AraC-like DNA-binding protein
MKPPQANDFIQDLLTLFEGLEKVSQVRICLHDHASITARRLPDKYYWHDCDYCQRVKATSVLEQRCRQSDVGAATEKAREIFQPFLYVCHANVTEVIVPVHDLYERRLMAVIFCGQVFSREKKLRARYGIRRQLPIEPEANIWAVANVIHTFFKYSLPVVSALADFNRPRQFTHHAIIRALDIMGERFRQPLTVSEVARTVGLSVSRFEHLFKDEAGMNFTTALRKKRVNEAIRLLTHTDLPVTEIANRVGVGDIAYFHRLFKRERGVTPNTFRNSSRQEI